MTYNDLCSIFLSNSIDVVERMSVKINKFANNRVYLVITVLDKIAKSRLHPFLWSQGAKRFLINGNYSCIGSYSFFISFSFFCLDTKERNKEKIKPADKELQNYGSLR